MSPLTIGSLCSGYGGLDLAVAAVWDARVAWHAETDPGACKVLARHWPGVPNLGDITTTDWTQVEPVDVITAGYPCQPFSLAGRRKGVDDDRHIWPHVATAIRVLRPRWVLLENVPGHLRLGFDTVLADLAALRCDTEWTTLRASDSGAPHRRKRLFALAWPTHAPRSGLEERREGRPARAAASAENADVPACSERRQPAPGQAAGWRARPDTGGRGREGAAPDADTDRDGRKEQQRRDPGVGARDEAHGCSREHWGVYGPAIARWAGILGRPAPAPVDDRRRLNPAFVEWLMGLPAGWVTDTPGLTRAQQLHCLGNGVVPAQAAAALTHLAQRAAQPAAA